MKVALHHGLAERLLGPLNRRLVAHHSLVVPPGPFDGLLKQVLPELLHAKASLARDVEGLVEAMRQLVREEAHHLLDASEGELDRRDRAVLTLVVNYKALVDSLLLTC